MTTELETLVQNGTTQAHGRTWPMYEHDVFSVEVSGSIEAEKIESAEALKAELDAVLGRYGVSARVVPMLKLFMLPEHQAEKEELDRQAIER